MLEENTSEINETVEAAELVTAEPSATTEVLTAAAPEPIKKGYTYQGARTMNRVFLVSLILFVLSLCIQFGFSVFSYAQQGAPMSISLMYTLVGMGTPLALCMLPFVFKFFAELLELKATKQTRV